MIANGHPGPVVVRTVVQEPEQERLMSRQNMVAKNVQAITQRVAKRKSAQVSKLPIHLYFDFFILSNKLLLHIYSVDCKWAQWSSCSQTCGPGNKTRTIEVPAKHGGQECPGNNTESCKEKECPGKPNTDSSFQ